MSENEKPVILKLFKYLFDRRYQRSPVIQDLLVEGDKFLIRLGIVVWIFRVDGVACRTMPFAAPVTTTFLSLKSLIILSTSFFGPFIIPFTAGPIRLLFRSLRIRSACHSGHCGSDPPVIPVTADSAHLPYSVPVLRLPPGTPDGYRCRTSDPPPQ